MLPSPQSFAELATPRDTTPASAPPTYSGPPESPGHASMPMPPAASSPPTTLQPDVCAQVASVIATAPCSGPGGSVVPSIVP